MSAQSRPMSCWECGFLFSYPTPSAAVFDAYYAPGGRWSSKQSDDHAARAHEKNKGKAGRAVAERIEGVLGPGRHRVLDVGCGTGAWLNTFADRGWETFGLEPSTDVAFARHHRVDTIPADGGFDLVMAYHVLEHVPRPLDLLRQLAAALRIGGCCFVSVPRIDALAVHQDVAYSLNPPHVSAFLQDCLVGLFARAELETVAVMHDLDDVFSRGVPLRLRVLGRRVAGIPSAPDPVPQLRAFLGELPRIRDEIREKGLRAKQERQELDRSKAEERSRDDV